MPARPLAPLPHGSDLLPVPGSRGLPLIGRTFQMLHDPLRLYREQYDRYGPVSWVSMFGRPWVCLLGPELTGSVLVNRDRAFACGPGWGLFAEKFFPGGLVMMDFAEHHHHRRIMQHAFTRDRLVGYLDQMHPVIERVLARWQPDPRFLMYPAFKQLTLDVATSVFLGTDLDRDAERINRAFVNTVRGGTAYVRAPVPGGRWARGLRGRRALEEFLTAQLAATRDSPSDDLLGALCQAETDDGERFSDADIISHMIFVLMASHDTATITMSTMGYYLARYPRWQDRARAESFALGTGTPGFEELDGLVALDLVMKESLRLLPPVATLPRMTVRETEVLGHAIPADTMVSVPPIFNHYLPEYWSEPERFDPERFGADRREDRSHQHAWIPFGSGVHKCIGLHFGGMEIKAAMHRLLRRYRWSVEPGYEMPVDWRALGVPGDRLPVRLERL